MHAACPCGVRGVSHTHAGRMHACIPRTGATSSTRVHASPGTGPARVTCGRACTQRAHSHPGDTDIACRHVHQEHLHTCRGMKLHVGMAEAYTWQAHASWGRRTRIEPVAATWVHGLHREIRVQHGCPQTWSTPFAGCCVPRMHCANTRTLSLCQHEPLNPISHMKRCGHTPRTLHQRRGPFSGFLRPRTR